MAISSHRGAHIQARTGTRAVRSALAGLRKYKGRCLGTWVDDYRYSRVHIWTSHSWNSCCGSRFASVGKRIQRFFQAREAEQGRGRLTVRSRGLKMQNDSNYVELTTQASAPDKPAKALSPLQRKLMGLIIAVAVGAVICCVFGAVLALLFSHTVSNSLSKDPTLLVLLELGFVSMSILTAFAGFVQSISDDYTAFPPPKRRISTPSIASAHRKRRTLTPRGNRRML